MTRHPNPLAGDLVFWVKLNKGVCKQMAATRSEAVTAAWSPCGRYVVTSTVAPRLRVDNNVRVFTYYGGLHLMPRTTVQIESAACATTCPLGAALLFVCAACTPCAPHLLVRFQVKRWQRRSSTCCLRRSGCPCPRAPSRTVRPPLAASALAAVAPQAAAEHRCQSRRGTGETPSPGAVYLQGSVCCFELPCQHPSLNACRAGTCAP